MNIKIFLGLGFGIIFVLMWFENPPLWIAIIGWIIIAGCAFLKWEGLPYNSTSKSALSVCAVFLVFLFKVWASGIGKVLEFAIHPSFKNLRDAATNHSLMILGLIYFASFCLFKHWEVKDLKEEIQRGKEEYRSNLKSVSKREAEIRRETKNN